MDHGESPPAAGTLRARLPPTLGHPGAVAFWVAIIFTGVGTGLGAAALTTLLEFVQREMWPSLHPTLLASVSESALWRRFVVVLAAGVLTAVGQVVLRRLASGNGIETTAAIWFCAGRLPALRTLGSAVLSVVVVAMGASLGREGAAKQVGAVVANGLSDRQRLSDEQRRLVVACGAGAGMAAAYGVPVGGALYALEVMRGALALRMVLPALVTSVVATAVATIFLPDTTTYAIPAYGNSSCVMVWALLAGPFSGLVSVGYVRAIAWADRKRPQGWGRFVAPVVVFGALGLLSIPFPQLLGNGRDVTQLAFVGEVSPGLLLFLVMLRPAATIACLASGAPGGLFTPTLALGGLLGAVLGHAWSILWPGVPEGLFAIIGATAVLAAATQGPISAIVLLMELTGRDRTFIVPVLLAVATATLVARTLEPRSIYDARLTDAQVARRQKIRDQQPRDFEPAQ